MKLKDFFKDKLFYAVVYFFSNALVILIMYLSLIINKVKFSEGSVFYAFLISTFFFIVFLIYDYYKNKNFKSQLNGILNSEEDLDYILNIGAPNTEEQAMFKRILIKLYKICNNKTIKYEEEHKQYIYFVNQWVHQMKTSVSVINLILQDEVNEENKKVFESIEEENEKLQHGLDMMLYNARLNEFNGDFGVEKLDVIDIVRKVINENKKSLIRNHIFPKVTNNEKVMVETDKKWITFAINQIVVNAIKYSKVKEEENKHITFDVIEENSKIILSIKDEGIGIPKEDLTRVFNAFFTGKNGRKTDESTGMGMYLVKRICNELGHGLNVKSEEGKGAVFFIIFYKNKNIFNFNEKICKK